VRIVSALIALSALCASGAAVAGDVAGKVYTANGTPAAHVQVSIAALGLDTVTDADGSYSFTGLAAGDHLITARADGSAAQRVSVTVADEGAAQRNIFLMSRMAVQQVTGVVEAAPEAAAAFATALELADQMVSDGPAQGEIAWRWRDLEG